MINKLAIRLYACASVTAALMLLAPAPALAQYRPGTQNGPAPAERYHIEASAGFWFPTADIRVADTALSQRTPIDLKNDLGLTDQRFSEVQLVLKPGIKHKLRFQSIPISYNQTAKPTRAITFNGKTYNGVQVASTFDWKAYRFGYEYDFVSTNLGFVGAIVELKYSDVQASLTSTAANGITSVRAPIPAVGGIVRVYLVPAVSLTGELTGIKIASSNTRQGHYTDFDIYGTANFTKNVGAQVGFRSLDVGYLLDQDSGSMTVKGAFVALVLRF